MKVCKKCKTHVANKAKICKKCGADVSKAKIIKTNNNKNTTKKATNNKNNSSKMIKNPDAVVKKKEVLNVEKEVKQPVEISSSKDKGLFKVFSSIVDKLEFKKMLIRTKTYFLKIIHFICRWLKKVAVFAWIGLCFFSKELFYGVKATVLLAIDNFKNISILIYKGLKNLFKLIIRLFKGMKSIGIKVGNVISKGAKNGIGYIRKVFNNRKGKKQDIKQKRFQKQEEKYALKQEKLKRKQELELEKQKAIEEARKLIELEEEQQIVEVRSPKKRSRHKKLKISIACLIVLSILGVGYVYGKELYEDLTGKPAAIVVSKKATKDKVFSMNDIVSYKGIDYKVVKIETSNGNTYKSPKEGNQFLIVTIYIKNTLKEKVSYSYQNWTMSNSKDEEKKRIFTSINVDTALYSGQLVRGGVKTGSMVFEQPIGDPKLKMNFYELKKDDEGNNVIDESKRVFSISVKVPNNKKDISDKEDVKAEEKSKN